MIITTKKIVKNRGKWSFSSVFTIGYITKASNNAIVKGKITDEVIFNTPTAKIQAIKAIKKKVTRPELNVLNTSFTF